MADVAIFGTSGAEYSLPNTATSAVFGTSGTEYQLEATVIHRDFSFSADFSILLFSLEFYVANIGA